MTERWLEAKVRLKHMPTLGGLWKVTSVAPDGWCQCVAVDNVSGNLAKLSPDEVVWFKKRDLIKDLENPNQGTLL